MEHLETFPGRYAEEADNRSSPYKRETEGLRGCHLGKAAQKLSV